MRAGYSLLLLLLVYSGNVLAQFNDSTRHMVQASMQGNFNRTADGVTYLFNNSLKYGFKDEDIVLNAGAKWLYGSNTQKLTNNDFNVALDCNLYKTLPHFYYWGLMTFTSSYSLRIIQQSQAGVGAAYRLIDREHMMFSVSNGILYEYSEVINEEGNNYVYKTFRNSLRLQYRINHRDRVKFQFTGFYQPSLQYGNDYILSAVSSLDIKLWRWLSANASFTYNKISRTGRENILITYGLVAERFF